MEQTRLEKQVQFILEVDKLKEIFRQTVCTQSRRAENDAEHSWHICMAVVVLAEHANEPGMDVLKVLKMLLIHDLVEIDAGDTFAYDTAGMAGQHDRESVAADRIFGILPEDQTREFRDLWDEFEEKKTLESRFANAIDRFQPCLLNTSTEGSAWKRHKVTEDRVIARNAHIALGSAAVWEETLKRIKRTVAEHHLEPGPAPSGPAKGP
jgi:putative hydrolase of HD superfamily